LDVILSNGGSVNFAVRTIKWPGLAAVEVSLVNIFKGKWNSQFILGNKVVRRITAYLDDAETVGNPYPLLQNADKSFIGSYVLGMGFILEPHYAAKLIERNPKNKDVLFPYLNGEDLNTNPDQSPSRWVISFFDRSEEECRKEYPDCFEIVERLVKPERLINNDRVAREKWWQFLRMRPELYRKIRPLDKILIGARVSKYCLFSFFRSNVVFSEQTVVLTNQDLSFFPLVNCTLHEIWSWKYCSTMGGSTLRYTPSDCFETFPFLQNPVPEIESLLEKIGEKYHDHRKQLMLKMQLGLTKTYNQFHNKQLSIINDNLTENDIEKKYGKETLNLWRHLSRTANTDLFNAVNNCSFNEAVEGIFELRRLHKEMDKAVLNAYGWTDIDLAHDFYEVDYLPENDRIRYTISPAARREVLKRLLELSHQIHAKELAAQKEIAPTSKLRKGKKTKGSESEPMTF